MFLSRVTEEETTKILGALKTHKSTGFDDISNDLLKLTSKIIAPALTKIINLSFEKGIVPPDLEIAKVNPLLKGKQKDNVDNYRPISILPALSKIFERAMFNRLYGYLNKYNMLYSKQYGFRQKRGTVDALLDIIETIRQDVDAKKFACVLQIDLRKAFDTVDHKILLGKLDAYGIRGPAHQWLKSYLADRIQYVEIGAHKSTPRNIQYGVPQGSILGPLLFLIYINDLPQCLSSGEAYMFADDTNVYFSANRKLNEEIERDYDALNDWLRYNRLSLNETKTECMPMGYRRKDTIVNTPFDLVESCKYLGVIIDKSLKFRDHVQYTLK